MGYMHEKRGRVGVMGLVDYVRKDVVSAIN